MLLAPFHGEPGDGRFLLLSRLAAAVWLLGERVDDESLEALQTLASRRLGLLQQALFIVVYSRLVGPRRLHIRSLAGEPCLA